MHPIKKWWAKQNVLSKSFYVFLLSFVLLIFGSAFFISHTLPEYKSSNEYTQSQKVYFHNVRSYYYKHHYDQLSGFEHYLLKRGSWDTNHVGFHWKILDNIRSSEAYIYPHFFGISKSYPEAAYLKFGSNHKIKIYPQNTDSLRYAAYFLLNHFKQESQTDSILLMIDGMSYPYLHDKKQVKNTQTILEDYFKLTE